MNKNGKKLIRNSPEGQGQKRFLINAAVLFGACLLLILRMPAWGAAQVVVLLLLAAIGAFQILLYFKLR